MEILNQKYIGFPSDTELLNRAVAIYRKAKEKEGAGVPVTRSVTHLVLIDLVNQLAEFNIDKQKLFDAIDQSYNQNLEYTK